MKSLEVKRYANLALDQAIMAIIDTEDLVNKGAEKYTVNFYCNEGFYSATISIDVDSVYAYVANKLEGDYVLAGVTTYCEDGEIEYHEEILTREEFNLFKAAADANPHYEDDGRFNGYVEYEDLLAN